VRSMLSVSMAHNLFESELIGLLSTEGDASVSWVRYGLLTNTIV